jgi:hypothetical protein
MSPYAYDYGAGGAALFDIVKRPDLDAAPSSAHPQGRFHSGGGAAILLSVFQGLA